MKYHTVMLYIDPNKHPVLKSDLEKIALSQQRSLNQQILFILKEYLKKEAI